MEKFDTTGTQHDGAINQFLDTNRDDAFTLETSAIAASRVFAIPQNTESLEIARSNPSFQKMWGVFQKKTRYRKPP